MDGYCIQQYVGIIKLFYRNECSVRATYPALHPFYGRHNRPTDRTIRNVVDKFESTGSENIAAVRESVQENPMQSISRRSQELGLSKTTTWRILRRDLGLDPYKI